MDGETSLKSGTDQILWKQVGRKGAVAHAQSRDDLPKTRLKQQRGARNEQRTKLNERKLSLPHVGTRRDVSTASI